MTLDNEQQRQMILSAIDATNWPGRFSEQVVKLKVAVKMALINALPYQSSDAEPVPVEDKK